MYMKIRQLKMNLFKIAMVDRTEIFQLNFQIKLKTNLCRQ